MCVVPLFGIRLRIKAGLVEGSGYVTVFSNAVTVDGLKAETLL